MTMAKKRHGKKGFTLVELIVVIAILAILAAILIPLVSGYINDAQNATGSANARTVYSAACAYVASTISAGGTPTTTGDLSPYLGSGFTGDAAFTLTNNTVASATWTGNGVTYTFTADTGVVTTGAPSKS